MTALLNAPAAIQSLLNRVDALEGIIAQYNKDKEMAAIDIAAKESENAKTSEDIAKAALDAATTTSHL